MINDKHGIPQPELTGTKAFHVECVRCFKTGTGHKILEQYLDDKGKPDDSMPPKRVEDGELLGYKLSILDKDNLVVYQHPYNRNADPFKTSKLAWAWYAKQNPIRQYEADRLDDLIMDATEQKKWPA